MSYANPAMVFTINLSGSGKTNNHLVIVRMVHAQMMLHILQANRQFRLLSNPLEDWPTKRG